MTGKNQIIGGAFQDAQGNTLANGYLVLQLSHDEQESVDPGQVVSGYTLKVPLDTNGNVAGTVYVWPNDQLSPINSYYIVNAYRSDGTLAWQAPQYQTITSTTSPFNLGSWVPSNPPPSTGVPAGSLVLQVNGTNAGSQSKLNAQSGSGITISDNGSGTWTFTNTLGAVLLNPSGDQTISNGALWIGVDALYSSNIGNTVFASGGAKLSTGGNLTAIGYNAGTSNTTAAGNTYVGAYAGQSNVSGSANTFVGENAGWNSTSSFNCFMGVNAGQANTTGNGTFVGAYAGYSNSTASANTYVGNSAGRLNSTGGNNTFIGDSAGYNCTTSYCTLIGNGAGYNVTTGSTNTYIGTFAGYDTQSGNTNTAIGASAGYSNVSGSGNVFIGASAGYNETGSNKLYISNSNTTTPLIGGNFSTNTVSIAGTLSSYNGTATAGIGLAAEYGQLLQTGQNSNYNSGNAYTLFTPAASGLYRITVYSIVTTPDGTSSTLPSNTIGWTDPTSSVAQTFAATATNSGNSTHTWVGNQVTVYAKASTAITLTQAGYASNTSGTMHFTIAATVEAL
jgi:hypothetical protein